MTDITTPLQHPVPYVQRVAQIICTGLYPEADAAGKRLADFPNATRENLLTIAEAILMAEREPIVLCAADVSEGLHAELRAALAQQSHSVQLWGQLAIIPSVRQAEPDLEPVHGDVLPSVGAKVLIHLASQDAWLPHVVVGYYVWPSLDGNPARQRVFVRVRDSSGCLNARMLCDVRRPDGTCYVPTAASADTAQPDYTGTPREGK